MLTSFRNPRHPLRFGVISLSQLNRALGRVVLELDSHGLWTPRLEAVPVLLMPFDWGCYGWQNYGSTGEICIPAVSLLRLYDVFVGSYKSLADVLRHEYAHALADTHRSLFRGARFREAFHTSHEDEDAFEYDPYFHVSDYAATNASEDFAETFMLYLRHTGRLPPLHATAAKRRKWRFIDGLCTALKARRQRPMADG